jgi:predicted transcriptional regulator
MTYTRWRDLKHKVSPERMAQIEREVEAEILEMNLRGMRELLGKTQTELAELLDQNQSQVSETEHREDHLLSTLRRYVEALGGEFEVIANFGAKRIRLV